MKLSLCIFILLGGVVADPIKARRGVLMFLNEALATTPGKNVISTSPVYRNPANRPVIDPDSEDMSEATSDEALTGILKDPDSQEMVYSKAGQPVSAADETTRRWLQDWSSKETTDADSEEDNGPPRAQPSRMADSARVPDDGSREVRDLDSLEGNRDRPAPVRNQGDASYNESRELLTPERSPAAPSENKERPSKSQRA